MRIYFPKTESKQEYTWASNNAQYLKSLLSWKTWVMRLSDYRNLEGTRPNSSQLQVLYTEDAHWFQDILLENCDKRSRGEGFETRRANPVLSQCLAQEYPAGLNSSGGDPG